MEGRLRRREPQTDRGKDQTKWSRLTEREGSRQREQTDRGKVKTKGAD